MTLDSRIREDILKWYQRLQTEGKLLSDVQLADYYARFRQRFGIDKLLRLDGQTLLETMHAHGNQDSLVYWLEFKNDEEFPAYFGSIAGGSALKFGIYRRAETGVWMTGSSTIQRELTLDEAISIARKHRDQLAAGVDLLSKLPDNASDEDYSRLQAKMNELAPDVSNLAWGHKYFTLMFPEKLDDFHNPDYQKFHLIKLLQMPQQGGRYASAGQYVRIAHELDIHLSQLTSVLNNRDGAPHEYWRIGTGDDKDPRKRWNAMREQGHIALGWEMIGELPVSLARAEFKETIVKMLEQHYPNTPSVQGRIAQYFLNFIGAKDGDIVMACDGATVLGIAKITGPYFHQADGNDDANRRPVQWLDIEEWKMQPQEQLHSSFRPLGKYPENLVEAERRILYSPPVILEPRRTQATPKLDGIVGRIQRVLDRKSQVILYGPPGTGKTYWAEKAARDLAAYATFGLPFEQLSSEQRSQVIGCNDNDKPLVRTCTFHPAYGYEDFIEGYRPCAANGNLSFIRCDGLFLAICKDAEENPSRKYFLIIDEINRGDIPRIFGELLTVIESSKREKPVLLPLSGKPFKIPKNVFVIGTMNTADRSIALLDTALRRRFGFIELMPDSSILKDTAIAGIPLGPWLDALNSRIIQSVGHDARNLQIGHSYLMDGDQPIRSFEVFARVIQDDLLPLLEEYCYEDYRALVKILGKALVDSENQRYRLELFGTGQQDNLVQALLERCPQITTSGQAISAEKEQAKDDVSNSDRETED